MRFPRVCGLYTVSVENLPGEDHNRGMPGLIETINRWVSLHERCAPNSINLFSREGERKFAGETVTKIVDVQLHSGHGGRKERSDGSSLDTHPHRPMMEVSERIQAVSKFLLESPPGEINDVLNGILLLTVNSPPNS